ncbi:hypothetical protein MIMGU_mgv1a010931mg [Erythranthe guttata]|uniref:Uncharacterized protein n=1 Tax=Erythranthe guttata TaxID=4155 RepID=A0A022RF87_ERYGU|nr:hypothetical protein MIMGU_mgv1a010931mg [Erythranthe guttata]
MNSISQNTLPESHNSDSEDEKEFNYDTDKDESYCGSYESEEEDDAAAAAAAAADAPFSFAKFVKQMFVEQWWSIPSASHRQKLIVIMVHAVMLDSGFAAFDKRSKSTVGCFHLRDELTEFDLPKISPHLLRLFYTLPHDEDEEEDNCNDCDFKIIRKAVLEIHFVDDYMTVYANLEDTVWCHRRTYRLKVYEYEVIPFLNVIWNKCWDSWWNDETCGEEGLIADTSPGKVIDKFLRNVREIIALPLLADLRLAVWFDRLPKDIKWLSELCFSRMATRRKKRVTGKGHFWKRGQVRFR